MRYNLKSLTISFPHIDEEGWESDIEIPGKVEICGYCRGKGTIVNPGVDGHGISPEEFREDPDFAEDYFSGVYDVPCPDCDHGRVLVIDPDRATAEQVKMYEERLRYEYESRREIEHQRRYGY